MEDDDAGNKEKRARAAIISRVGLSLGKNLARAYPYGNISRIGPHVMVLMALNLHEEEKGNPATLPTLAGLSGIPRNNIRRYLEGHKNEPGLIKRGYAAKVGNGFSDSWLKLGVDTDWFIEMEDCIISAGEALSASRKRRNGGDGGGDTSSNGG